MNIENQYLDLLATLLQDGNEKTDRTNVGTLSKFGVMLRHDLTKGFPLLTTKKVHFKSVAYELLWFLKGSTNTKYLNDNGVTIWNEWQDKDGNLGKVYGAQWCNWRVFDIRLHFETQHSYLYANTVNQIAEVINEIKNNPDSRRLLVSAWNVSDLPTMALPPCHYAFQFYVLNNKLSCMFQMRSTDVFLGLPFNIASYALLTHFVAQVCDLDVGELIFCGGDVHLYKNHIQQAKEQLNRTPYDLPTLRLNPNIKDIFEFDYKDIELQNYAHHSAIKANVAI